VVDEDGPTPAAPDDAPELIDPADIPELHYDKNSHPIPHQPWRRGTTEGCEDPIEAPWRQEAEQIIKKAARMVGGNVIDVTWYLTQVVITVDDAMLQNVDDYTTGPEIILAPDDDGPEFFDPEDPNPEPIWADEEEYLYERDDETEEMLKKNTYARKDDDDDDDDDDLPPENPVKLLAEKETREDMAAMSEEEEARLENEERPVDSGIFELDTAALSTMARAILDALEPVEDSLHVLERHEVILTSPGAPDVLETQRQFDAWRGFDVIVETQDPFNSNRVLKGKLLTRNSMDLVINKKGRMVTIPLNFVKCVKLPPAKREKGVPRDAPF
jgi:ribosome maturation factor RimP